jgi:hypothetical protein
MELNSEIKPMLNTRARGITFCGGGDGGWGSEKIARLEGAHEANKIMKDQIYECVSMRELIRQIALTPLNTLLEKYKGLPRQAG